MVAQLPIELLQIIFQDAPPQSLRAYRLVDHQWCAASTPYLFERFHASLFLRSLTKLSALAHSPLAKYVKTIEFHTDQLPDYTQRDWETNIDARPSISAFSTTLVEHRWTQISKAYDKLPKHNYTEAQLVMGWLAFQTYRAEQERWSSGQAGFALKECLLRLHNLHEVRISSNKPFRVDSAKDTPFWQNIMSQILVGPDAWKYSHQHDGRHEALSTLYMIAAIGHRAAITDVKAVETLVVDLPEMYSLHDLVHLPHDVTESDTEVWHDYIRQKGRSFEYKAIVDAFRPLKHLVIRCPSVTEEYLDDSGAAAQAKDTEQFLTAAVNLRSLDLGFGEPNHDYEEASEDVSLFDVGLLPLLSSDHKSYPHLEELKISAAFPADLFKQFLVRHKDTLKKLDICDCLSDDWNEVLTTVAKDLSLDDVYVESLWTPPANDIEDSTLMLGEGQDADDDFSLAMRIFLQTGEGSVPRVEDYDGRGMRNISREEAEMMLDDADDDEDEDLLGNFASDYM